MKKQKETAVITDLSKLDNETLASIDLDNINLYELLAKNKNLEKLTKRKDKKESIYKLTAKKENETDKNFRSRIRKERNYHIEMVISFFEKKLTKDLQNAIKDFDKFYKETYQKNDYAIDSMARLNSDKATLAKLNIFLTIVKKVKTKKN